MDVPEQQSDLSFEAALARLEEIVRLLERGEAPLDQSIELYQEGDRLRRHCEARLKAAAAQPVQPEVHIRANRGARYDVFAAVMAAVQRNGITRMGVIGHERFVE